MGEEFGGTKLAPPWPTGTEKIRIAEATDSGGPVGFATRPEIAASKSTEDCWPAGVSPFALQCVEQFFDCVHHTATPLRRYGAGSGMLFSAKPFSRKRQASHWPQPSPVSEGS